MFVAHRFDGIGQPAFGTGIGAVRLPNILQKLLFVGADPLGAFVGDVAQIVGAGLLHRKPDVAAEVIADAFAHGIGTD